MRLIVWVEGKEVNRGVWLSKLKPRRYMCANTFEEMLKYTKKERISEGIKDEEVVCFEILNARENWIKQIKRLK